MKCQTPECMGEHEAGTISHTVIYQERTFVIHNVPAALCPDCGEAVLAQETIFHVGNLLGRKAARARKDVLVYEV